MEHHLAPNISHDMSDHSVVDQQMLANGPLIEARLSTPDSMPPGEFPCWFLHVLDRRRSYEALRLAPRLLASGFLGSSARLASLLRAVAPPGSSWLPGSGPLYASLSSVHGAASNSWLSELRCMAAC